jgi:hypothetical protein
MIVTDPNIWGRYLALVLGGFRVSGLGWGCALAWHECCALRYLVYESSFSVEFGGSF